MKSAGACGAGDSEGMMRARIWNEHMKSELWSHSVSPIIFIFILLFTVIHTVFRFYSNSRFDPRSHLHVLSAGGVLFISL